MKKATAAGGRAALIGVLVALLIAAAVVLGLPEQAAPTIVESSEEEVVVLTGRPRRAPVRCVAGTKDTLPRCIHARHLDPKEYRNIAPGWKWDSPAACWPECRKLGGLAPFGR